VTGLCALKTHDGGAGGGRSRQDPLSRPEFQILAARLPYAKRMHSKLICAVTREVMDDSNPPMVLPNGYVYSRRGIEQLAAASAAAAGGASGAGGGRVVCPRTGAACDVADVRRAYIV